MTEKHAPTSRAGTGVSPRAATLTFLGVVAGIAILAFGLLELQRRGTDGVAGFGVVDRPAATEVKNSPAPSFSMETLDGGTVSLDDMRGDIVVINFWATWCTPCRQEAPTFRKLWREYRSRGVRFLGIDELDDRASAQAFVREFGLGYPSVFDPAGSLADDFSLFAMPTTYLVDQAGVIRYRFVGYVNEGELRTAIDALLDGTS